MATNDAVHILEELPHVPDILKDREWALSSLKTKTLKEFTACKCHAKSCGKEELTAGRVEEWVTNCLGRTEFIRLMNI